jgi:hypothetical protein
MMKNSKSEVLETNAADGFRHNYIISRRYWPLNTAIKGNVDYFDKAIQFIQPPRILLLGAVIAWLCFYFNQLLLDR